MNKLQHSMEVVNNSNGPTSAAQEGSNPPPNIGSNTPVVGGNPPAGLAGTTPGVDSAPSLNNVSPNGGSSSTTAAVGNSNTTPVSASTNSNTSNAFTMPVQAPMLDMHAAASHTKFHALMSEKFRDLTQMPMSMQDIENFHLNPPIPNMDQV